MPAFERPLPGYDMSEGLDDDSPKFRFDAVTHRVMSA